MFLELVHERVCKPDRGGPMKAYGLIKSLITKEIAILIISCKPICM